MSKIIEFPKQPPNRAHLHAVAGELARVLGVIADEMDDQADEIKA